MPTRDWIVIGTSAGGVEALLKLVRALPYDLPAAFFIVIHFPANITSLLPEIRSRQASIPAKHPQDGEAVQNGIIYIAPPNKHLTLRDDHISLSSGPRENGFRPAIDPLFRSPSRAYRRRAVGVILPGPLEDGVTGSWLIKSRGGIAIVQDPQEAIFNSLPHNAQKTVTADYVLPASQIASTLNRLSRTPLRVNLQGEAMPDREEKKEKTVFGNIQTGRRARDGCLDFI